MKKITKLTTLTLCTLLATALFINLNKKQIAPANAYSGSSLPTTIKLNDNDEDDIRGYYSDLNSLVDSEKTGTNLLKNLKPILKNNQKYYTYNSGDSIWRMYEITDRDWELSPAENITNGTYDSVNNQIVNYKYKASTGNDAKNPYVRILYHNRNIENEARAWGDHSQTSNFGFNREHIWPKSHGFNVEGTYGAIGDPMHLWAGQGYVNNIHSNYFYGNVGTITVNCGNSYSNVKGNYLGISKTLGSGTVFEPQDSDKGDIARAVFYMVARYNNYSGSDSDGFDSCNPNLVLSTDLSGNSVTGESSANTSYSLGLVQDLLEWNKLDPVDEYEIHRNNILYNNFTNNRNPFIDFPEWADYIWGEDSGSKSADPENDTINGFNSSDASITISSNSETLIVGDVTTISATTSDGSDLSWNVNDDSIVSISSSSSHSGSSITLTALKKSTTTVTASAEINGKSISKICTVTVRNEIEVEEGLIEFGTNKAKIDSDNVNRSDSLSNNWNIVTTGTTSYTANQSYYQVGSQNNPASSITFTMSLPKKMMIQNFSFSVGGFSSSAGSVNLKIDDVTVASGSVPSSADTVVATTNNVTYAGTELKITIDNISRGIKIYQISYECFDIALDSITASGYKTSFEIGDSFSFGEGIVTAHYVDGSTKDVTEDVNFMGFDSSEAGDNVVTILYTENGITKTTDYEVIVSPIHGTIADDPLTIDEAIEICESVGNTYSESSYFIQGVIKSISEVSTQYGNATFTISESANSATTIAVFRIRYLDNAWFTSIDQINVGDKVIIVGQLINYNNATPQTSKGYIYDLEVENTVIENEGVIFDASTQGYTNAQEISGIQIYNNLGDSISGTFNIGTGNNVPKYYNSNVNIPAIRLYAGGTLTINSSKTNLKSITFTFGTGDSGYSNTISTNAGTYSDGTWSGNANQVIFTISGTTGQRRIATITVEYYSATDFATEFLNNTNCDETGNNAPNSSWSAFSNKFDALFAEDKNTLLNAEAAEAGTNIERAMKRYDYIVNKYHYTNFINRSELSSSSPVVVKENNTLEVVLIIISSLSLIGFASYLLKKKKIED